MSTRSITPNTAVDPLRDFFGRWCMFFLLFMCWTWLQYVFF